MSNRLVYFNGEFVAEDEARVSIFDSALMFGDMAFEMTRTYRQQTFRLRHHLQRLYGSLRLLEIDCGLTIEEMERLTLETLGKNIATEPDDMDWQIMHDVSRGPLPIYKSAFAGNIQPTVSINCWPLITHITACRPGKPVRSVPLSRLPHAGERKPPHDFRTRSMSHKEHHHDEADPYTHGNGANVDLLGGTPRRGRQAGRRSAASLSR